MENTWIIRSRRGISNDCQWRTKIIPGVNIIPNEKRALNEVHWFDVGQCYFERIFYWKLPENCAATVCNWVFPKSPCVSSSKLSVAVGTCMTHVLSWCALCISVHDRWSDVTIEWLCYILEDRKKVLIKQLSITQWTIVNNDNVLWVAI